MGSGDVLGISVSGALAAQRALSTTSHNIANAATEGFTRQKTDLVARQPTPKGNGAIGTGVIVSNVRRVYNDFVTNEVRDVTSVTKASSAQYKYINQIDNMLSDPESGLAPAIQSFFAAVNGVADEPSSTSARQVMISEAKSLADRFGYLDNRFEVLRGNSNKEIRNIVRDINNIASSIAEVNVAIIKAREIGGSTPNDLLDQRDRLLLSLAEKVSVRTSEQDDGQINVFIGNGQNLVVGGNAARLDVMASKSDPSEVEITFESTATNTFITKFLSGGELGGILDFKKGVLNASQNDLGRIAIGIAKTFNEQHHLGMDLKSHLGGSFFEAVDKTAPQVKPRIDNGGDLELSAIITDIDKVKLSNYGLSYDGSEYSLIRLQDDALIGKFTSFPANFEEEGFSLDIRAGSSIEKGDSFIIQPVREAGQRFKVLVTDVAKIAAATPVRSIASISNEGDGEISAVEVLDVDSKLFHEGGSQLEMPLVVHFIDTTHFEILDNHGKAIVQKKSAVPEDLTITANEQGDTVTSAHAELASAPSLTSVFEYNPDEGIHVFPTPDGLDLGIRFRITGDPRAGDEFHIEFNSDGIGDNTNAVLLASLQDKPVLAEGTADYGQLYAQLVSRVGSQTHELEVNGKAQEQLLSQAVGRREAISGVNMDEEAANLIRYQKLYQANAQVIKTAKELFDTLINTFR